MIQCRVQTPEGKDIGTGRYAFPESPQLGDTVVITHSLVVLERSWVCTGSNMELLLTLRKQTNEERFRE